MSNGTAGIVIGYIGVGIVTLVIIIGIILAVKDKDGEWAEIASLISLFAGMLLIALPLGLGYNHKREYYASYETVLYEKIESVDRGSTIEGHFSIFGGSVDSYITYYFYVNTERGYELKEIRAKDNKKIYLVENNNEIPHVIEKKEVGVHAYVQIIVPVGTVVKEYRG